MRFHNKSGQSMNLADNLTIKELLAMGIDITISEKTDPAHELWLADELKGKAVKEAKHGKHVH